MEPENLRPPPRDSDQSTVVRALRSLRSRGPADTWAIARREVRRKAVSWYIRGQGEWFDYRNGVTTQASFRHPDVGVAGTAYEDARIYGAARHWEAARVVRRLKIDPSEFTFIDLGCGRGRMLFVAARLGFRRAIGVELDPDMAAAARRNITSYRGPPADVTIIETDAAQFDFPDGPLFVFLFDPFGDRTVTHVADRLAATLRAETRPAYVLYHRAWYRERFARILQTLQDDLDWSLYAAIPASD